MKMSLLMEQYGILLDRHRQPFPSFLLCLFLLSCFQSIRGVPFQSADGLPFHITNNKRLSPPIVYTVAGSDSGGGAGIQADLHAIHNMYCHGCSAITCLTAQNSVGVTGIHAPPLEFLQQQLDTLWDDLPPRAIKIGMLGTKELAIRVGKMLKQWKESSPVGTRLFHVVLDPVMISTSGSKLIEDDAVEAMIQHVFPHADVLTPNKFEAQALLNRTLETPKDVEQGE
jgi:hydroxymethylpyrimidine kinase/phosphomethylpyrimidine kinase